MLEVQVENHGAAQGILGNPHGTFNLVVPGGETVKKEIPLMELKNMYNTIVGMSLRKIPGTTDDEFTITILVDDTETDLADAVCAEHDIGIVVGI